MATIVLTPTGTPDRTVRDVNSNSATKRTFKDKLLSAVQEAEIREAESLREAQLQDKKSLCISLLLDGRTQAFVDLFNITHGNLGGQTSTSGRNKLSPEDLPQDSLLLMQSQLGQADVAAREGNLEGMHSCYKTLAAHFSQQGRLDHAEFFLRKSLRLARESGWAPGIVEGHMALGSVYEGLDDIPSAISSYERQLAVASENSMTPETNAAYRSLTTVYLHQAVSEEKEGNVDSALSSYSRCLGAAERSGNLRAAAYSNLHMGMLHHGSSRWQESIFHLRRFIEGGGAEALGDSSSEGLANTTLAQCMMEVKDTEGASALLESYLEASVQKGQQAAAAGQASVQPDLKGIATACCTLGVIHYDRGDFAKAVVSFERLFEISRSIGDRGMTDCARFNLGASGGALRISTYMNVVADDLPKLLAWKIERKDIF